MNGNVIVTFVVDIVMSGVECCMGNMVYSRVRLENGAPMLLFQYKL